MEAVPILCFPLMEESYVATGDPKLAVQVESEQLNRGGFSFRALPVFNTYSRKSHWIDVYNQGRNVGLEIGTF